MKLDCHQFHLVIYKRNKNRTDNETTIPRMDNRMDKWMDYPMDNRMDKWMDNRTENRTDNWTDDMTWPITG